jgi:hypothetical protein
MKNYIDLYKKLLNEVQELRKSNIATQAIIAPNIIQRNFNSATELDSNIPAVKTVRSRDVRTLMPTQKAD